jgi:hypothetical protein
MTTPTTTPEEPRPLTNPRLSTPGAAAAAGILFSFLLGTSMVLIFVSIPNDPASDTDWLTERKGHITVALTLIPFAAIAFLWFIGVIRDHLGEREDQFFATIFLGSGLLFLAGLFVWMAVVASVLATASTDPDFATSTAYTFGASMIDVMGGAVTMRMAGVFMFSSAVMWQRTRAMRGWLFVFTYLTAVLLLFGGGSIRYFRLSFPIWVLVVSLMILIGRGRERSDGS